jgi:hypothetical protein
MGQPCVVHPLRLAGVAELQAQRPEAEVSVRERRVDRERLGVAPQRDVLLVGSLVRARLAHELDRGWRRLRPHDARREHRPDQRHHHRARTPRGPHHPARHR